MSGILSFFIYVVVSVGRVRTIMFYIWCWRYSLDRVDLRLEFFFCGIGNFGMGCFVFWVVLVFFFFFEVVKYVCKYIVLVCRRVIVFDFFFKFMLVGVL